MRDIKIVNRVWEYILSKMFYSKIPKDWIPDEIYLKWAYRVKIGKKLNLKKPEAFTEKIQWLKLYDRRPEYTMLVDKYAVKKYVAEKIGEKYIIPLVGGPWKNFSEIDFDNLPEQFVLKTTHDSGGIVICKDKRNFDKIRAEKILMNHLYSSHWKKWREWAYKDVPPRIIAETYMKDSTPNSKDEEQLTDYKIFCFNGEPKLLFIATDRFSKTETKFDFFDMEYHHLPFTNGHPHAISVPEIPASIELMKKLAKRLAQGIPQCRIDFYDVCGNIYFGEITMYHYAGLTAIQPYEWDVKLGKMLKLP